MQNVSKSRIGCYPVLTLLWLGVIWGHSLQPAAVSSQESGAALGPVGAAGGAVPSPLSHRDAGAQGRPYGGVSGARGAAHWEPAKPGPDRAGPVCRGTLRVALLRPDR